MTPVDRFPAYRVHQTGKFGHGPLVEMSREDLDAGNVVVRIAYASVNCKDARAARVRGRQVVDFSLGTARTAPDA